MQQKALNDKNLKKRELPIAADFENMLPVVQNSFLVVCNV